MYNGNYNPSSQDILIVSTPYIPGYRITKIIGFTWGLIVRSRGLGGNIAASLRSLAGGEIKEYTKMLDQSRSEALERLKQHAKSLGANAVIEVRFDSSEIGEVMSEILAYGTAVEVEKDDREAQPVLLK
ncbi:MAG: heavy metal-binding domain-containing protein [Thermoplasmatales archaeon]